MTVTGPQSWLEFAHHTVIDCPEYLFDLNEYQNDQGETRLVAHITIHKFTPSIFKRIKREWVIFRQSVTAPLFAWHGPGPFDKWLRFISCLGFRPTGSHITCNNGEVRQIYISEVGADVVTKTDPKQFHH
jgi:hypothetical protein